MGKTPNLFRRKMYKWGHEIMIIPLMSYSSWALPLSAIGASIVGVLLQSWHYSEFPPLTVIVFQILVFSVCAAVSAFIIMVFFKGITYLFGCFMKLIGEMDKVKFEKGKDAKILELIIENNEDESFSGQFKIMRINDEELGTPLLMGIVRDKKIDSQIVIPKGEHISVALGIFNEETNSAYFPDYYNENKPLNQQTRVYTKLSGNLEGGTEIIKEDMWFINYVNDSDDKKLGFANLVEVKSLKE